jgi:hypothetical protein
MVLTSCFGIKGKDKKGIAISVSSPSWYSGRIYPELYPPIDLVIDYKRGTISQEEYTYRYNNEVLAKLDPFDVIDIIGNDAILLCWEGPGKFCHRRLVAKWLEDSIGIEIPEYRGKKIHKKVLQREFVVSQTTLPLF